MEDATRTAAAGLLLETDLVVRPEVALLRAVADGRLVCTAIPSPRSAWPTQMIDYTRLPTVVHVGDAETGLGPQGWRTAKRLRGWAYAALVIPGGPATAARTEQVIEATLKAGRLVLVETRLERLAEWGEWFEGRSI